MVNILSTHFIGKFRLILLIGSILILICVKDVHCNCVLPTEFQNSQWNYKAQERTESFIIQFTTSQLEGFGLTKAFIYLTTYDCIKNVTLSETESILIFKSTLGSFNSNTLGTNYVFLCLKVTIVSNEAAYFYLLNDIQPTTLPNERVSVYESPPTLETDQICNTYCTYDPSSTTTPVITDDIRHLTLVGSSATIPNDASLCQPCDRSCATVPCPTLTPVSHSTVDTSLTQYNNGDTVTYTCDEGYDITSGNKTRTCMEDGQWNGNEPVCSIVSCPELSAVSDSTRDPVSSANVYNQTVTYTCNVGYEKTSGDLQRVCECNGTWSGVAPVCSIKSCPALPTVQHSSKNPASPTNTYNEVVTYTCNTGYEVTSGDLQRSCQANEKWTGASPVCTIKSCPALPAVAQSSLSPSSPTNTYNEVVTYTCNTGYELTSGNLQRTCQDSKQWSGTSPVCGIKSCPALTTVSHATRNPTSPTNNYNEVVAYTCNAGYEIISGNAQRTCQDDKTWSGHPPVCGIKSCPALTTVSHATRDPTSPTNNYNEVVKYTCNAGYEITSGNAQRTCQDDKKWSGNPPVCAIKSCPALPAVAQSSLSPPSPTNTYNEVVTYTCNTGYELTSGNLQRTCHDSKQWSDTSPVCGIKSCPALTTVSHATRDPTNPTNNYNEVVKYTCNTGYETTSGNAQRTCQDDKTWSGNPPVCAIKSCPALPAVAQSSLSPSSPTNTYNEVVTYTCNTGYEFASGNRQRTCQDSKQWSDTSPVCGIKSCPALTTVSHATRNPTSPTNNYNEVVAYTCNAGYEIISGNAQRTCQDDKTWSGNPPVCGIKSCPALTTVSHATRDPTNPTNNYNEVVKYTCNTGYEITSGNAQRTCQDDKTWSGNPPVCGKVDCGSLLTVPLTMNDYPGTQFNDVITYTCDSGSQLISGSLTRRCQADKTWDGSPPVCEQEKYSDTYKSTFIAVATPVASVSIVILIGAVVVYVSVLKIVPKSKHGKSSEKQTSKRRNHKKGKWWSSTMYI